MGAFFLFATDKQSWFRDNFFAFHFQWGANWSAGDFVKDEAVGRTGPDTDQIDGWVVHDSACFRLDRLHVGWQVIWKCGKALKSCQ
jgi:hypothetical protein